MSPDVAARATDSGTADILASMNMEIAPYPPSRGHSILCEDAKGLVGYCEVPACDMRSTPLPATAPSEADICVWVIERGTLTIEQNSGIHTRFGPGSVLLCDVAQTLRGHWERSRFGFVRPSRQQLLHVLGHAPGPQARAIKAIDHLALAPFLGSQLGTLANLGASLGSTELQAVLGGIFQTAEALLKAVYTPGSQHSISPVADRLQLVHRYIQRNLHQHDLSVVDIARGTSNSRAQLYRLFASQDKSVHGTLREERLIKSLGYLRQPDNSRLSIGAIAFACGFSDQAVFSKLFRRRFTMTPRDARERAVQAQSAMRPS
jgi:AraC-like DNA-binding protein